MKLQIIIRTILLILQLLIVSVVDAQTPYQLASHNDLFSNDQPLEVTIEMDIKLVIKDITDRKYHPAIFVYKDPDESGTSNQRPKPKLSKIIIVKKQNVFMLF